MTEENEPNSIPSPPDFIPSPPENIASPLDGLNDEEILEKYRLMHELEHEESRKQALNTIIIDMIRIIDQTPFARIL